MRSIFGLGAFVCVLLLACNVHAVSKAALPLNGGNSTLGYTATAGFSDSYTSSGTIAYQITPSSTVAAKIFNNSFNLFSGSDSLQFRRDSKVRKVCSLSVANVSIYYNDQTVSSGDNNLSVAFVKDGPTYTSPPGLMVGPIPIVVKVGTSLSLGVKGTATATPTACTLSAGVPSVDVAIKAAGGVGGSVPAVDVLVGVQAALSLLNSELQPKISLNYVTRRISYDVNWVTKTLNGALSLIATVKLKNPWGWPIGATYTYDLFKWPPAGQVKIPVYINASTSI